MGLNPCPSLGHFPLTTLDSFQISLWVSHLPTELYRNPGYPTQVPYFLLVKEYLLDVPTLSFTRPKYLCGFGTAVIDAPCQSHLRLQYISRPERICPIFIPSLKGKPLKFLPSAKKHLQKGRDQRP